MDLLKILRSLEEFVFEATTWLLFYPLTMWAIVRRPLATLAYSDREQREPEERRYDDRLSPPLLLLVTVLAANLIGAAAHVPPPAEATAVMKTLMASQQNIVLFRSLTFSLVPLVAAATLLRRKGTKLSRETMRPPFYAQCYLAAPCSLFVSVGAIMFERRDLPDLLGAAIIGGGTGWFLWVQTRWFRQELEVSWVNAALTAAWAMAQAMMYLLAILIPLALV